MVRLVTENFPAQLLRLAIIHNFRYRLPQFSESVSGDYMLTQTQESTMATFQAPKVSSP